MNTHVLKHLISAIVVIAYGIMFIPILFVVWLSFFNSGFPTFPPPGYTGKWYLNALNQQAFYSGFLLSINVAALSSIAGVILSTMACVGLTRTNNRWNDFLMTWLLSPLVVPGIVISVGLFMFYLLIYDKIGWNPMDNLSGLIMGHILLTIPWGTRLIAANIKMIDPSLNEAAKNLGATPMKAFFYVTLPMMRAGIVAAFLISFIISFENVELSLMIVTPGYTTLPIALLQYLEFNIDPTVAAASTIQAVIIGVLLVITDRFVKLSRAI